MRSYRRSRATKCNTRWFCYHEGNWEWHLFAYEACGWLYLRPAESFLGEER